MKKDQWLIKICCDTVDVSPGSYTRQQIEASGQFKCHCGITYELKFYKNKYHHIYCGLLAQFVLDGEKPPELDMYKQLSEYAPEDELLATPIKPVHRFKRKNSSLPPV